MILVIFGAVYAICLAIVGLVFVGAKPLPARSGRSGDAERANPGGAPAMARGVFGTHH